ncbi:family 78 glycoside hydrolase catalytic domain [Aporhodopirellula aestuarii]|uniref:alpha-L-rhamnosidase n=1 Tax=Aporhodopirellula aestuarii TaxID=2950107 RepID=A0ABT0UBH7_9BACT|nr:family 78 glycoside hydrolase catalytic domain [Aporhodopirellula aestuarii]MCM2374177.1 glycoside hydrolase family 78 protein [Aporhodopirellula aestuarii]
MNALPSFDRRTYQSILWMTLVFASTNGFAAVAPVDLRCEYRTNPLGIDNTCPRLSWKLVDTLAERNQRQTGYRVVVASSLTKLNANQGDLWDSGLVEQSDSQNIVFAGERLTSGMTCYWKVRVRDAAGATSDWSAPARFTIGLLNSNDWLGSWIHKEDQLETDHNWFRKTFSLSQSPSTAFAYVASFGYHELYVNGRKVGDGVMNPAQTFMKKRIPYLTYDLRDYLKPGKNVVAIWHAAGWVRWRRVTEYRTPPFAFKAQIEIGSATETKTLVTDETWKCRKSHSEYIGDWNILDFGGERIDARNGISDWNQPNCDDTQWDQATVWEGDIPATLSAQMVEPQVKYETITPCSVTPLEDEAFVIDMGRNYSGHFQIHLRGGKVGQKVLFEITDQKEKRCNWNQKSEYVFDKTGEGLFTNRFNLAGGRWITVSGLEAAPTLDDITGYVITSNRKRTSAFECSNKLLNRIYEMNIDTYIANTLDGILMDCPHRERRGWGEVTVAAIYGDALPNFESGAYMDQYTQFMRDAQFPDGRIRAVINEQDRPFLMWKANSPITIWATYQMLGDKKILEDNYASMEQWMTWLFENSNYATGGALIIGEHGERQFPGLGDWCTPKGNFWDSSNSPEAAHFNNCLYAFMLDRAVKIATALGKNVDAETYSDRLNVQRRATHTLSYDSETGDYGNGQQVNQAFALIAGVPPESERQKVYDRLVDEVLYEFPYYDCGSSGQALYTRYFTEYGERMDLVYELLCDEAHPSYGYFIAQDETVWPERWSSLGDSRIHTCYTGIGGYFIKGFGGIRPDPERPGMRHFLIKPTPVGDLTFAKTKFLSGYGRITVNWTRTKSSANYCIEIPVNCSAKVYIPAVSKAHVREGDILAEQAEGVLFCGEELSDAVGNYVIYEVGSGTYEFSVSAVPDTTYPEPIERPANLATIARMSASSMHVESEKLPFHEAFKSNDENPETAWEAASDHPQWLEADWIKPQTFNRVQINEVGNHITNYRVQAWKEDQWHDLASGDSCGNGKQHVFEPVTTSRLRLQIESCSGPPEISELKIDSDQ